MKRYITIIVSLIMILAGSTSCCAQKEFAEIAKMKGVTSVYMGQMLLKLAGGVSSSLSVEKTGLIKEAIKEISSIEIISCDESKVVKKVRPIIDKRINEINADVLMEAKESDGENVTIYATPYKNDPSLCSSIILLTEEDNEINLIVIKGKIDPAKIANIAVDEANNDEGADD